MEQRRTVRRAPSDSDATPGVNRAIVVERHPRDISVIRCSAQTRHATTSAPAPECPVVTSMNYTVTRTRSPALPHAAFETMD